MKKKINILYITVRSDIGGGPIHINELIKYIDRKKYNVFLGCPISGSIYLEKWKDNSQIIKHIRIPHRKFVIKTFIKLIKFVKDNNIDVIHSHGKGSGIYSRILNFFLRKIKVIHTFHGLGNIIYKGILNKIKNVYPERLLKKYTLTFISVSEGEKKMATSILNIKSEAIKVVYNGVKDTINEKNTNSPKQVVTFSRFSHQKNMMASYDIIKKTNKNILFNWIGDGDDFNMLKSKKEKENIKNLTLTGFKNKPQRFLTKGSIYLSTARHEGLPLALLEAEANGIPIVATNVVGNNEVVIDGYNGFLFSEEDLDTAVKRIEELFNDKILYDKISKNARKDYLNRFTVGKMISATEKIYDEISFL
jgi:glycosyltransferase involved in cell wall biosynthesis